MKPTLPKGHPKLLHAWAFYDWANSVYSLTIVSAIFPIFYGALFAIRGSSHIEFLGWELKSTALVSFVTALAFLVVAIGSPLLSGIADYMGNKKRFMQFYCTLGSLSCIGLYWFSLENIYVGMFLYFLGVIGFWGSIVFYNSYLPDIADPEQHDALSAKGYILGYLGSVLLLIFNLAMVMYPNVFGITGNETEASMKAMKYSFITVGIWWLTFSQYSFYYLPRGHKGPKVTRDIIFNGYKELRKVWVMLKADKRLKRYLLAFFVFSMAVQTVMLVATYFGEQEIRWSGSGEKITGLIVSILLIQLVAAIGAKLTAKASSVFGNIPTLIIVNAIWLVICVIAYFITLPIHFYLTAVMVGLVMGGIQALGRSTYSKFLPVTIDTTSFFSFYDVAEKVGIVVGMLIYGFIDQITGSMRNSVLFLVVFFAMGIVLLRRVPKK